MNANEKILMTVKETISLLGLSRSTIRNLTMRGDLKALKVMGRTCYRTDEVRAFVANLSSAA